MASASVPSASPESVSPAAAIYADTGLTDVIIADGYCVSIRVTAGHLHISDGVGQSRRERRIPRVPRTAERLLILSSTGMMTADACRWLADAGIPWVQLDRDGRTLATSGAQREDARLLRAQAFATEFGPLESVGIMVMRDIVCAKLDGQARNLDEFFNAGGQSAELRDLSRWVSKAESLDDIRTFEGRGAAIYWQTWAGRISVPFPVSDMTKVPVHWIGFDGRTSLGTERQTNKGATCPVNAMLNYAYAIAEAEAVNACHAVGLHPALGILHTDKLSRDSMALDLIEVIRPAVDRLILSMLDTGLGIPYTADGKPGYLDRKLFTEQKDGTVRLVAPLTHRLAARAAEWGADIRQHAEQAARTLALAAKGTVGVPRQPRRYVQGSRAPLASKCPVRLREGTTARDLVPDDLWARIVPLIPEPPLSPMKRQTGRPIDVTRDRDIIAGLIANVLLSVPWSAVPVQVTPGICKARLKAWTLQTSPGSDTRPAWDAIAEVVRSAGHLSALV